MLKECADSYGETAPEPAAAEPAVWLKRPMLPHDQLLPTIVGATVVLYMFKTHINLDSTFLQTLSHDEILACPASWSLEQIIFGASSWRSSLSTHVTI